MEPWSDVEGSCSVEFILPDLYRDDYVLMERPPAEASVEKYGHLHGIPCRVIVPQDVDQLNPSLATEKHAAHNTKMRLIGSPRMLHCCLEANSRCGGTVHGLASFLLKLNTRYSFLTFAKASIPMGYTERVCQLCGISFNIGRIRKHGEPESDAWDCYAKPGGFVAIDADDDECRDGGCQDVRRDQATEKEHIAGPDCRQEYKGYSGWRIGAGEMRVSAGMFFAGYPTANLCMGMLVEGEHARGIPITLSASRWRAKRCIQVHVAHTPRY
jgi:hypothetical protein